MARNLLADDFDEPPVRTRNLLEDEIPEPRTTQEAPRRTFTGRLTDLAKETGAGAIAGALAPEITTGLGLIPSPISPFLLATGQALRGQRAASAVLGGLGGGAGELAAQITEAQGRPTYQQEVARFTAGTLAPEPIRYLGQTGGRLAGRALGALGFPGADRITTIAQVLGQEGVDARSLTQQQREFIQRKIGEIRQGKPSLQAQQEISDMLRRGAGGIVSQAEREAAALESQATDVLSQAQQAAGRIDATLQQRLNNLQSQFEAASQRMTDASQQQAQQLISQSQTRANRIMQEAMDQSPQIQQLAKIDADQIIAQGRQQADQLMRQSQDRIGRMRQIRDQLRQSGQARVQQAAVTVGEPQRLTQIGREVRDSFTKVLDDLKATRKANAETNKQAAFGEAFQKEAAGLNIRNTQASANAIQEINALLINPVSKLPGVPVGQVRNQLQQVKGAIEGVSFDPLTGQTSSVPQSFEALEIVRRSLRDRASGLPAEGYDAIGQQQAGRLADLIERAQVEFSPQFATFLKQYRDDSVPINKFANDLGKAVTGKSEADFNEYAVDAAKLAARVFESEATVAQLLNTAGPEQAERIARSFVASKLRNATSKDVESFINNEKTRDWLFQFPKLEQELRQGAARLATAERTGARRETLAGILGTEMRALPTTTGRAMTRAEEDAARTAQQRLRAGEREAGEVTRRGETAAAREIAAGEKAFGEVTGGTQAQIGASAKAVERQTKALQTEAEKRAAGELKAAEQAAKGLTKEAAAARTKAEETARLITAGEKSGPARVRDLIKSENDTELMETAKIILQDQRGKEVFSDAVSQVVADLAESSVKGAANKWKYMGDSLVKSGLLDEKRNTQIANQLQEILVTPANEIDRLSMIQSLFRNALVVGAGTGAVGVGEAIIGE
jgi:hypothetical protein